MTRMIIISSLTIEPKKTAQRGVYVFGFGYAADFSADQGGDLETNNEENQRTENLESVSDAKLGDDIDPFADFFYFFRHRCHPID